MSEADRYEPTYVLSAFHEAVKSADKYVYDARNYHDMN